MNVVEGRLEVYTQVQIILLTAKGRLSFSLRKERYPTVRRQVGSYSEWAFPDDDDQIES